MGNFGVGPVFATGLAYQVWDNLLCKNSTWQESLNGQKRPRTWAER